MGENLSEGNGNYYRRRAVFDRRNPLNWLIFGGVLLVASIAIGTAITVMSFRERALDNTKREPQNTVLLLARHFDRELQDFEAVQRAVVRRMERLGIASPEDGSHLMISELAILPFPICSAFHSTKSRLIGVSSAISRKSKAHHLSCRLSSTSPVREI